MSLFKGSYLRVLSPKTTDGRTPMIGADGKVVLKEQHLPISAKRDLEIQNKDLPEILKKKIEIVNGDEEFETATTVKEKPKK